MMTILVRSVEKAGSLVSKIDSRQFRSGYVKLEQGKEVGNHSTGGGEELVVLLGGTAEVSSGGEKKTVHAPAVVLVPANTMHNIRNTSRVPLRYVYVYNLAMD